MRDLKCQIDVKDTYKKRGKAESEQDPNKQNRVLQGKTKRSPKIY